MAQREFFLFLLAIIIVALAAVAGIYAFAEGTSKNRQDTMMARGVELASYSQEWMASPRLYGGGNGSFEGVDIWQVTGQKGTGEWLEEGDTRYSVEPMALANQARLTVEDELLELRIVMLLDGNSIISTEFLRPGVIYIDP